MASQYTTKRFFQKVDLSLLRIYFAERGELQDLEWDNLELGDWNRVYKAWTQLSEASRAESEQWFRATWALAVREGLLVIFDEAEYHGVDIRKPLSEYAGLLPKAFWVYLKQKVVFEKAWRLFRADSLNGRYWKIRTDLPACRPDLGHDVRKMLRHEIEKYYWSTQERGNNCNIEVYRRPGDVHALFCYPSDYADTALVYDDDGKLQSKRQRAAFDLIFQYHERTGALEVYVQGGKKVRQAVEEIFCRLILKLELPELPTRRGYHLNHLAHRGFRFRLLDPGRLKAVRIRSLRLNVARPGYGRITIESDVRGRRSDIYDLLESHLNQAELQRVGATVSRVEFEVVLVRDDEEETVRFAITEPDLCNLKENPEHQVIKDHFETWGLLDGAGDV
ncbi:MAG: hypothetical protein KJZ84_18065 [Bryobacteraceae bacterium]|nr:hypothetical protein [Bryobacteraceae bacterium]